MPHRLRAAAGRARFYQLDLKEQRANVAGRGFGARVAEASTRLLQARRERRELGVFARCDALGRKQRSALFGFEVRAAIEQRLERKTEGRHGVAPTFYRPSESPWASPPARQSSGRVPA
jgi:hypothetical protein